MLLRLIDNKIRRAFSDAAMQYEILASLQKDIGRDLVKKIEGREPCETVLDIGMGTGWLTNRLAQRFPGSYVAGMDFAPGMVEAARGKYETFDALMANASALPFREGSFDIVASNLAYQWVPDLPSAMGECRRVLKPGGALCVSIFGAGTLPEMFRSFSAVRPSGDDVPIRRLPSRGDVERAVRAAGLQNIELESEVIRSHFTDLFALLKWLKTIGANVKDREVFIGRDLLAETSRYYTEHFKDGWGVAASFEVIWLKAEK